MLERIADKFIEWTSLVEVDEAGNEYLQPWTLEEFLRGAVIDIVIAVVIFVVFFK